jgi:serine/threonine protein kinase
VIRERFLRKSCQAASSDHPNIVPTSGAAEDHYSPWIATRYVEGGDLRVLICERGRPEPDEAYIDVAQVAQALDVPDDRGLVHRAVKPGNILIEIPADGDGELHAYLSGFGLTKRPADDYGFPTARCCS